MLRVFSHRGINLHHRCGGNLGLISTKRAMRWALPVWMDHSALFLLCICGGVSCSSILLSVMNFLMGAEHSLSILQYFGFSPICRSRLWTSLNVCRCSAPALVFRQRMRIVLMLYTYTNMMYRHPRLEMMGKAPVWSEKIVLVGWKNTNALLVFLWRMDGCIGT